MEMQAKIRDCTLARWRENETEHSSLCFESWLLLIRCPHGTVVEMAGLSRLTAGVDVEGAAGVLQGRMALADVQC